MDKITAVGLDLAKQIIQVHAIDRNRPGGAAQGGAAGAAAGAISALRSGDGSVFGRASLGARVDPAGARPANHGGRVRTAVSQESGGEERRQRCRGGVYSDAATEHALRD